MSRREPVRITEPCEHAASLKIREVTRPGAACEHATAHFKSTAHPIITSVESGETWVWCYVDEAALAE
jgi:hypothetical protein